MTVCIVTNSVVLLQPKTSKCRALFDEAVVEDYKG